MCCADFPGLLSFEETLERQRFFLEERRLRTNFIDFCKITRGSRYCKESYFPLQKDQKLTSKIISKLYKDL